MATRSEPMRWVMGRYEGEQAQNVIAHMYAGLGYFKLKLEGRGKSQTVVVAFRQSKNGELPIHLEEITNPYEIDKLNKREAER